MNKPLTALELGLLEQAASAKEWDEVCDLIKEERGGSYPPDWFEKVLASGLAADVMLSWE